MELINEVSVGNWLYYGQNLIQIDPVDILMISRSKHYGPINLEDDILLASDFWYDNSTFQWRHKTQEFRLEFTLSNINGYGFICGRSGDEEIILTTLHSLQNLFKIVTGTELIFNKEKLKT